MFEALSDSMMIVLKWNTFVFMLFGIALGFIVGILPGLGGSVTLALMLPFTFDMTPVQAFAFLLGMSAVVGTTGDITSILFGVPGEATTAATVLDGHAMAKKGEAGRALGAALMSSLVGAFVGAFTLAAIIPVVRPLVLSFGSPEFFILVVLGITLISSLGGGALLKGFIAGGVGLMLGTVGRHRLSGIERYTFDLVELWDGVGLVPVTIGLFAIPEIVELAMKGTSISRIAPNGIPQVDQVMQGVKDTFRHFWLTVRCAAIGTFIGILPGLGNAVSQWIAYAHAVQSSPDKDRFGKGAVEGVLGPGASNNAGIGGALIPTVAFGIPGGLSMAILLGAFLIQGLTPGPSMLTEHLDLTLSFVWIIVLSNLITVPICFLLLNQLVRLTLIRGAILIPSLILLVYIGTVLDRSLLFDTVLMLLFGLIGLAMIRLNWPRAPIVLGLVLGPLAEQYLAISTARYGTGWLTRPMVLGIAVLCVISIVYGLLPQKARGSSAEFVPSQSTDSEAVRPQWDILFVVAITSVVAGAVWSAQQWEATGPRLFPWVIGFPVLGMGVLLLALRAKDWITLSIHRHGSQSRQSHPPPDNSETAGQSMYSIVAWMLFLLGAVWLLSIPVGGTLGTLLYLKTSARESWWTSVVISLGTASFFFLLMFVLNIRFPQGILF